MRKRHPRRWLHWLIFVIFVLCWGRAWILSTSGASKDDVDVLVGFPVTLLLVYFLIWLVVKTLGIWLHDVEATTLAGRRKNETAGQIALDVGKTTAKDVVKLGIATAITSLDLLAAGGGGGGGGSSGGGGGGGSFGGGGASGSW